MPKITAQDIKDLGFVREMYSALCSTDELFTTFITNAIAEQALKLEDRIGTTVYADAARPNADYVKMAEKYLSAAEMIQRRINIVLGNSVGAGQELDTSQERKQRQDYLDEAESWIAKLAQGVTTDSATGDFASGSLVTSHFE